MSGMNGGIARLVGGAAWWKKMGTKLNIVKFI
jgi:hypothetical protein